MTTPIEIAAEAIRASVIDTPTRAAAPIMARAALTAAWDTDEAMEVIAIHTPDLVNLAPDGVSDGQHLYCVECGVLPDPPASGGLRHVAEALHAHLLAEPETKEAGS